MDNYLYKHFKGRYRVLPELDIGTNNFVRTEEFADFYIPAKNGKLKHATGNELWMLFNTKGTGTNFLKTLYKHIYNKDAKCNPSDVYYEELCGELLKNPNITEVEVLDGEVYVVFKTAFLDEISKYLGLRTLGADIEPFSVKNLPSRKSKNRADFTEEENEQFKTAIENIPLPKLRDINSKFFKKHKIENPENYKPKDIIKKSGLWDEYIVFILKKKKEILKNETNKN